MIHPTYNRHRCLKEEDLLNLIRAFPLWQVTYIDPYLYLGKGATIDRLVRKAARRALNLPMSTATAKLLKLGI